MQGTTEGHALEYLHVDEKKFCQKCLLRMNAVFGIANQKSFCENKIRQKVRYCSSLQCCKNGKVSCLTKMGLD